MAMSNYICKLDQVEEKTSIQVRAEADDRDQLLVRFMEEVLEACMIPPYFLTKRVQVELDDLHLVATW